MMTVVIMNNTHLLNEVIYYQPLLSYIMRARWECNVIVLYIMVARNTIYEFLIHSGLMIQPVPTENNMSRLNSRGPLICSAAI